MDLDFWVVKEIEFDKLFEDLKKCLSRFYVITDSASKFYTILLEIKSKDYPRSLKLEIRKEIKKITTKQAIAHSKYSNTQVLLIIISLKDMMAAKIETFLGRKEIRDVFDIEFLLKKGISLDASGEILTKVLKEMRSLTKKDYTVKLGSLLESAQRRYYLSEGFKVLARAITSQSPG